MQNIEDAEIRVLLNYQTDTLPHGRPNRSDPKRNRVCSLLWGW